MMQTQLAANDTATSHLCNGASYDTVQLRSVFV